MAPKTNQKSDFLIGCYLEKKDLGHGEKANGRRLHPSVTKEKPEVPGKNREENKFPSYILTGCQRPLPFFLCLSVTHATQTREVRATIFLRGAL